MIGAGAIGGLLAAKLAEAGEEVSVVARGPISTRSRERPAADRGRRGDRRRVKAATASPMSARRICIILGMKAHQVAAVARDLPAI